MGLEITRKERPIIAYPAQSVISWLFGGLAVGACISYWASKKKSTETDSSKAGARLKKVAEVMTKNPYCGTPDMQLEEIAKRMVEYNCGSIPIVQNKRTGQPVGIITDRDIVCRTLAVDKDPQHMKVGDAMTREAVFISEEASIDECCRIMEENKIRRILVINKEGKCTGIVAQADIANSNLPLQTTEVVKEISKPC